MPRMKRSGPRSRDRRPATSAQFEAWLKEPQTTPDRASTLLRFNVSWRHEGSHAKAGLFAGAYHLRDRGDLAWYLEPELHDLLCWFGTYLDVPTTFWRRKSTRSALCWFKDTAHVHIAQARSLAWLLEEHGYSVFDQRTTDPGYVVYEDRYQVAAIPSSRHL